MLSNDTLKEKASHLIEYARHSKEEDLDNVVEVFVTFIREQRNNFLEKALQTLKHKGNHETIVKEGQGKTPSKLSERQTL